jgi:hypothetical protein
MDIKFIVKNMCDDFHVSFDSLPPLDQYRKLQELKRDLPKNIKQEDNQFNQMLELNMLIKSGMFTVVNYVSPRRGYKVHTFTFKGI